MLTQCSFVQAAILYCTACALNRSVQCAYWGGLRKCSTIGKQIRPHHLFSPVTVAVSDCQISWLYLFAVSMKNKHRIR